MFENEIAEIKDIIVSAYNPKAIILFGSVARNEVDENSDIDLLVIMDSNLDDINRTAEVRSTIGWMDVPIDIIVKTPEEYYSGIKEPLDVCYEASIDGRIIYGSA